MPNPKTLDAPAKPRAARLPEMTVRVAAPKITIPKPQFDMHMDSTAFADAIKELAASMRDIAVAQTELMQAYRAQQAILEEIAKRDPVVNVAPPAVNVRQPARPKSFTVYTDDGGEPIEMEIRANSPN